MSIIEIHEFSTGVKVQSSQVLWWVEDYTEEDFMNCTLEPIPDVVYQAIDEELLKIPYFPQNLEKFRFLTLKYFQLLLWLDQRLAVIGSSLTKITSCF
jgi:hypothetical protein